MTVKESTYREINNSVNIMRLMCAYLVVVIHVDPLSDINVQVGFFVSEVMTRVAVPFFFLVAGYYYLQKIKTDRSYFKVYIKKLLSSYCVWAGIYYIVNLVTAINIGYFIIKSYIVDCVIKFFLYGPYYHLWYIPALFIAVFIVTFAEKIRARKILFPFSIGAYVVGVVGCSYYQLGVKIPGLGTLYQAQSFEIIRKIFLMGLPFFVAGYAVAYLSEKISKSGIWLVVFLLINIFEIYFVTWKQWSNGVVLTFALYPLVLLTLVFCLQHPMKNLNSTIWQNRVSKFIYFSHPLFVMIFKDLLSMTSTLVFLCVSLSCTLVGIAIWKTKNRYLLKLL